MVMLNNGRQDPNDRDREFERQMAELLRREREAIKRQVRILTKSGRIFVNYMTIVFQDAARKRLQEIDEAQRQAIRDQNQRELEREARGERGNGGAAKH